MVGGGVGGGGTFFWGGGGGGGGAKKLAPPPPPPATHHILAISRSYIVAHFRRSYFKLGNFTNGALSSGVDGFSLTDPGS